MEKRTLDTDIKQITELMENYETLPDNKKLENISEIDKLIARCTDLIDSYQKMLTRDAVNTSTVTNFTQIDFEKKVKRADEIKLLLDDDTLQIEDMIKLYTELSDIVGWCKKYIENEQLEVVYLK